MYTGYEAWARGLDLGGTLPLPAQAVRRTYIGSGTGFLTVEQLRSLIGLGSDESQDDEIEQAQRTAYATIQQRINRPLTSGTIRNFYKTLEDRYTLTDPVLGRVLFKYVAVDGQLVSLSSNPAVVDPSAGDSDSPVVFAPISRDEAAIALASESQASAPYVMEYSSGGTAVGADDTLAQVLRRLTLFEYHLVAGGPVAGKSAQERKVNRQNILNICEPFIWRGAL